MQQIVKYDTGQPIKYNLFIKMLRLEKYSLETNKDLLHDNVECLWN